MEMNTDNKKFIWEKKNTMKQDLLLKCMLLLTFAIRISSCDTTVTTVSLLQTKAATTNNIPFIKPSSTFHVKDVSNSPNEATDTNTNSLNIITKVGTSDSEPFKQVTTKTFQEKDFSTLPTTNKSTESPPTILLPFQVTLRPVVHTIRQVVHNLPPVEEMVTQVQPMIEMQQTDPPNVVLQGLVVFMPTNQVILTPDTDESSEMTNTFNKSINDTTNNGNGVKSHLEKNLLLYGDRRFVSSMYFYVVPCVIGICLLTTLIFTFVLIKRLLSTRSQLSKASCLLLISIAVADILTMFSAVAEICWLFSQSSTNNMFLPWEKCRVMLILERLSAVPHAASTWFTVILAIQRYICVSRPFSARHHVTIKSAAIYILSVSVAMTAIHICRFFDKSFKSVSLKTPASFDNITTITCQGRYADWVENPTLYESLFAWLRIVLAQLMPGLIIVCFVSLMIRALRGTTKRTMRQITDSKLPSDRRQLTLFVTTVATIVFLVEISSGIFLSFTAWELSTGQEVFSYESLKTASVVFDLILYVSYFAIFLLYCLMSKDFRKTFLTLCCDKNCINQKVKSRKGSKTSSSKKSTSLTPLSSTRVRGTTEQDHELSSREVLETEH